MKLQAKAGRQLYRVSCPNKRGVAKKMKKRAHLFPQKQMAQMCPEYIDVCINFITAVHAHYR
jgi:hypothetical protein